MQLIYQLAAGLVIFTDTSVAACHIHAAGARIRHYIRHLGLWIVCLYHTRDAPYTRVQSVTSCPQPHIVFVDIYNLGLLFHAYSLIIVGTEFTESFGTRVEDGIDVAGTYPQITLRILLDVLDIIVV